jgi:hypothetical protein
MRRLISFAALSSLLLTPAAGLAAFDQPGQVLQAIRTQEQPRTFSSEVHGHKGDTYFAAWMSGSASAWNTPSQTKLWGKMTVDVVRGVFKLRGKLEMIVTDGRVFVKLDSVDVSMADTVLAMSAELNQKKWVEVPMDDEMLKQWQDAASLTPQNTELVGGALEMTQTMNGANRIYKLSLQPEVMGQFKTMVSEMFSGYGMADLPDAIVEFGMTAEMTAGDAFVGSSAKIRVLSGDFEMTVTGNEKRLGTMAAVNIPADYLTSDQFEAYITSLGMGMMPFGDDMGMSDDMMTMPEDEWTDTALPEATNPTFETIEPQSEESWDPRCTDEETSPLLLLSLQRTGECPTVKPNTR